MLCVVSSYESLMKNRILFGLLLLAGLVSGSAVAALTVSDPQAEKEMAELLSEQGIIGDIQWLNAGGRKFLSVYAKTDQKRVRGAAIVIHDMRHHTNTLELVGPVRRDLLDHGWNTLAIQMPVVGLDNGMRDHAFLLNESPPRIQAAIKFLKAQGAKKIVIIGHGFGAIMAASYLIEKKDRDVDALVGIGWYMLNYSDPRMWTPDLLKQLRLPILDIFGTADRHGVARVKDVRARAAQQAPNPAYTQIEVEGADHDFLYMSDTLIGHITKWLEAVTAKNG